MKKRLIISLIGGFAVLGFLVFGGIGKTYGQDYAEKIKSFGTEIIVDEDGSFVVKEAIL